MSRHRLFLLPRSILLLVVTMPMLLLTACAGGLGGQPDVMFLKPDEAGNTQLFRLAMNRAEAEQLTGLAPDQRQEVSYYRVSPNARTVIYAVEMPDGANQVRLVDLDGGADTLLLACPTDSCTEFAWAPDSRRLIYERRDIAGPAAGQSRLWWLDSVTGETVPVVPDGTTSAYGAAISPDGTWLAYVSPAEEGVVLASLDGDRQQVVDSRTGMPPVWQPDGEGLLISDLHLVVLHGEEGDAHETHGHDYQTATLLFRADREGSGRELLSPELGVDDGSPALSPDGEWIAFGRRPANTGSGRQLWVMRGDGSEARALTDDPAIHHGPPIWSPDGRYLLHQRYDNNRPKDLPSLWLLDVGSGEATLLAPEGFLPAWLID